MFIYRVGLVGILRESLDLVKLGRLFYVKEMGPVLTHIRPHLSESNKCSGFSFHIYTLDYDEIRINYQMFEKYVCQGQLLT